MFGQYGVHGKAPGDVKTGTTIMAATFDGGVVLGADTRTSGGAFVFNRATNKLSQITDSIYVCRSGSAADTQAVAAEVSVFLSWHEAELNDAVTVKSAAHVVQQSVYKNKDHYEAGIIVAGYDRFEKGAVYSVPLGGSLIKVPFAIGGSGSAYIYAWCDKRWKPKMTEEECKDFVKNAVAHAIARDGASGGSIRLVVITKDGVRKEFTPGEHVVPRYGDLAVPVPA